ncbi:DUF3499 family protein [Hoyosella rhizosphaerae]|uniref:DUF3499 domain-containing protein n=1 Tax=Hoyosella rhizosphaerae TaxID=1755582 RepID=A0A916UA85_9ACTN|nr:hypothetical protein GCM10011410_18580 [Hoyosella rhizosphaerae]
MFRLCCKPGCKRPAVATLTYVYAASQAVVGELAAVDSPHSWDLCEQHAMRITAPMGWELIKDWVPESQRVPENSSAPPPFGADVTPQPEYSSSAQETARPHETYFAVTVESSEHSVGSVDESGHHMPTSAMGHPGDESSDFLESVPSRRSHLRVISHRNADTPPA